MKRPSRSAVELAAGGLVIAGAVAAVGAAQLSLRASQRAAHDLVIVGHRQPVPASLRKHVGYSTSFPVRLAHGALADATLIGRAYWRSYGFGTTPGAVITGSGWVTFWALEAVSPISEQPGSIGRTAPRQLCMVYPTAASQLYCTGTPYASVPSNHGWVFVHAAAIGVMHVVIAPQPGRSFVAALHDGAFAYELAAASTSAAFSEYDATGHLVDSGTDAVSPGPTSDAPGWTMVAVLLTSMGFLVAGAVPVQRRVGLAAWVCAWSLAAAGIVIGASTTITAASIGAGALLGLGLRRTSEP